MSLPSERATEAVSSRREPDGAYGDPKPIYDYIARLWTEYVRGLPDGRIAARDVAFMQAILKMAREVQGNHNEDNFTDLAGYADVAEMVL